ncbi:armadillo-type protein [Thamnocephalis sphaerospora]|uniref:Armadillo-type protein n=1 Tax=Thamnocephalis sphaerospora TaxID=78915 RepID=A0A4P9XP98_9FUNG|nr:armadillo-type protein [Thamnocephalis sphaerospora]|eukprot:RKP07692.1 armadillo-type protein [Thamnocephalis sphaerospora]
MEKLLKWAILNSATAGEDTTKPSAPQRTLKDLDPGIIDVILGKDDAAVMREIMEKLEDPDVDVEQKEVLFEDLEMLVGHIDNAQNLVPLKMWPRVLAFLDAPEPEVRLGGAWIAGTSVQNNPKAKLAFIQEDGLPRVLDRLQQDEDADVRAKALYCLSSLLQNAPPVVELFATKGGYDALLCVLQQDTVGLQRKTLFLLHQLAIQCPEEHLPEVRRRPFISEIVRLVDSKQDDEDLVEKALRALAEIHVPQPATTAADTADSQLTDALAKLRNIYPSLRSRYESEGALSADEWDRVAMLTV